MPMVAKTFGEIIEFNPYHDARGRFASANGATSFTFRTRDPAKQHMADMAAEREKQRAASGGGAGNDGRGQQTEHRSSYLKNSEVKQETINKVASDLGVSNDEATKIVHSLESYSDGGYRNIRKASRGEPGYEWKQEQADACETFIRKSPQWAGGQIHRGLDLYDNEALLAEYLSNAQKGKPLDLRGISSWTSSEKMANKFARAGVSSTAVVLHTNGNTTSHGASIAHLSSHEKEEEVLVSKDAVFTPTRIEKVDGVIHIYGDMP